MSKLCKHCGAEMDDEAYECPECLTKIPGAEMIAKQKKIEKQQKLKRSFITAGAAVLAVALITGITILVSRLNAKPSDKYMKPVEAYIEGCRDNDYDTFISAFPDYFQKFFTEQFAYIVLNDLPDDQEKLHTAAMFYHDSYYRTLAQTYGTDFDVTYTIHSEKQYTPEELAKYQDEYRQFYSEGLGDKTFEDGYSLTVTFTTKGNLGSNSVTKENFQVINIDGQWYMMSYLDFTEEKEETSLDNMR